jgi:hypothetical protein
MKKIISIALCLVLCFGLCTAVFAEDNNYKGIGESKITVVLNVADDIDISEVNSYTITFTGVATESAPEGAAITKTKTVTLGAQSGDVTKASFALSEVFSASDFSHAGVWQFTFEQTSPAAINSDGKKLVVDENVYTLNIHVINGTDGLVIDGVTVYDEDDKKDPSITDPTVVDPTTGKTGLVPLGVGFVNEYTEELTSTTGVLTVTKQTTGDYADLTKNFEVTVVVTIPATATSADVVASSTGTEMTPTWDGKEGTYTSNLSDGKAISFTSLPSGTTFTVSEVQSTAPVYRSKITGFVSSPDDNWKSGDNTKTGAAAITKENMASASVNIENNIEDIIDTGIIVNNLPFVLIVLLAVSGIAVYFVINRRREQED